jgi:hypothetical protein
MSIQLPMQWVGLPHVSGTACVWYRKCLVLHVSGTARVWYCTCLVQHVYGACSWPITSIQGQGEERVQLHLHLYICLRSMEREGLAFYLGLFVIIQILCYRCLQSLENGTQLLTLHHTSSFLRHVCKIAKRSYSFINLSVHPYRTTNISPDGFSWYLIPISEN